MSEEIYLSHTWKDVELLLNQKIRKSDFILDLSKQFKKELNLPDNVPIIMTGHQPIIYYPGIFIKLLLADLIARRINGKAYYVVLDTDIETIDWKFIWINDNTYFQRTFYLSNSKQVLLNQFIDNYKKIQLQKIIEEWSYRLYHIFEPSIILHIQYTLEFCRELLNKKILTISEFSVAINEYLMKQLNVQVQPIYVSELSKTKSFKEIIKYINKENIRFRDIYNQKLNEFRKNYHIKNPHYPFSNLNENELPFWISDGYTRKTLTIYDDFDQNIFPKAITLSICIRIFLSDMMIHGTGGGFYDLVAEEILLEFFHIQPSPHIVTTATIPTYPKASIPIEYESSFSIIKKLRKWKFNPEIFLNDDCFLKKQKLFLIHLKNYYDSQYKKIKRNYRYDNKILNDPVLKENFKQLFYLIEKNPASYGALIHKEFIKLNHKMHLYTSGIKRQLEKQYKKSQLVEYHQKIFYDRTYPAFYYNIKKLKEELENKFLNN
ncbi:MAG: hypothetical protein KatS3mg129_1352 [Leptospiraceae bacterium]|nr:MAG: hypothetical protein KatS3mg129_1352 [Leptospiraceae bacterium]